MFEIILLTVNVLTALLYRYNEGKCVPGIVSVKERFGMRVMAVTTAVIYEYACV